MRHKLLPFKLFAHLILVAMLFTSCKLANTEKPGCDHADKDWIILFNGEDAGAWRGFQKAELPGGWTVENGLLVTSGQGGDMGGDIISKDVFEDFHLSLEWNISEGGNSGIFFNVIENGFPTVYATGPEYQLIDDIGFEYPLEKWQQTGANYAMHIADSSKKIIKPAGQWNHSEIRLVDGHVVHWLNGEMVLEYDLWDEDWKNRVAESKWKDYPAYGLAIKGHLGLQDHGSPVKFRNIKILDLTDKGKALFNGKNLDGWKIHGTEKWYVENGELVCESGDDKQYGYLVSDNHYKDFILRLRFLQEDNGNSGVFFRSSIEGIRISGWQVEVAPPGHNSGGIYESYGRGWLNDIPDEKEDILTMGQWNEMHIKVEGERVMTWLNGQLMTDLQDSLIGGANGSVALQIHDGGGIKIRWKDIYLKELNKN
jgi:hypothetical protein